MLNYKKFRKITGVHITTEHNDKMAGLWSISTAPTANNFCMERAKNEDSICFHCFSMKMQYRFSSLESCLKNNLEILTTRILTADELPLIPVIYCRFEAFGDLMNATQFINYLNIAKANPKTKFAIWTKNVGIVAKVFKQGYSKPENLNIIVSSPFVGKVLNISRLPWADKVFTVFSDDQIEAGNIDINCGANSCFSCGLCYEKNSVKEIRERLK